MLRVLFIILCNSYIVISRPEDGQCVKLNAQVCRDLNYNMTLIPNVKMNVDTREEAIRRISEFSPLFKIECFANLKYFMCNMFLPMCYNINDNPTPVFPCRHVCEAARAGCEPVMNNYGFEWPEVLRCDYLQSVENKNALCGSPPDIQPTKKTTSSTNEKPVAPTWITNVEKLPLSFNKIIEFIQNDNNWKSLKNKFNIPPGASKYSVKDICDMNPNSVFIKKENKERCYEKCGSYSTFKMSDRKFAAVWISVWSVICLLSTLLTVTTFLIDQRRFKYPERPIIFLSFCYNLYSIGYLIRVFRGYENIVCDDSSQGKFIIVEGMSVTSCTLVFFFLYFFGMASALWWVILSMTWFLSAALKWGHEAIEKYSSIFHALAWTVPTIQTIVALVTRKADPDNLSGLCYIGNNSSQDLLLFVALPLLIYLLIGTLFLLVGFVALVKIRRVLLRERNTNKFERLMLRIGVFSVLYSVPASIVVGCFIHEYNRLKRVEKASENITSCTNDENCINSLKPQVELFYLRYFMLLVVGVTSGVWIWTSKTLSSWKTFYINHIRKNVGSREEKKRLHKNSSKEHGGVKNRRSSTEQINQYESGQPATSFHGSSSNMTHNRQVYVPPPTAFYFPVAQKPAPYMQAHNMPLSHAKHIENNSRGYTITPISNLTSTDENSHYKYDVNNFAAPTDELTNPQTSVKYPSSNSDQHSVSQPSYTGSLARNGRVEPPSSPKSVSTRSYYSSDGRKL